MSNTPKPQANKTIDEKINFILEAVRSDPNSGKIEAHYTKVLATQQIQALITQARNEGMALTELDRFDGLDERQIKILIDYHQSSLGQLKEKL